MNPKVSVIIPTYNRAKVLPRAINSVLSQKHVFFELIIVDDGSTDETKNSLVQYGKKIRYFYQDNKGVSAARNLGIKNSTGEYIAFLDSDDEWLPQKLKTQLDFFEANPDYLICQTEEIWIRGGVRVNPMKKHKKFGGWIFEKCLPLCVISPSAAMLHKKLFTEIGFFDESLPACEDYDLWLRIASRYKVGLIPKPYIKKYGGHSDQLSRSFTAIDRFRLRSLAKILNESFLTHEQARLAEKTFAEKAAIYIEGAGKRGKELEARNFIASLSR